MEKQIEIKVITYEEDRLNYFTSLMEWVQKRYDRFFKKFRNAHILSEEARALEDVGRELQFYQDVVEMLRKGYGTQSGWISVKDELPAKSGQYAYAKRYNKSYIYGVVNYSSKYKLFNTRDEASPEQAKATSIDATHWMPLPEPLE